MNRLGPSVPPPLTIEFTREEADSLSVALVGVNDPTAAELLAILQTYLEE